MRFLSSVLRKRLSSRAAEEAGVVEEKSFLQRKLEREIDALYERIASDLREENARLKAELEKLRSGGGE